MNALLLYNQVMADSTQVNIRYSNILLSRIDAAASSGGVSRTDLITEACRQYLDGKSEPVMRVRQQSDPPAPHYETPIQAETIEMAPMNEAMEQFLTNRAPAPVVFVEPEETEPLRSCGECDNGMVSKYIKGRGMVFACTDNSCPMYGLERI